MCKAAKPNKDSQQKPNGKEMPQPKPTGKEMLQQFTAQIN